MHVKPSSISPLPQQMKKFKKFLIKKKISSVSEEECFMYEVMYCVIQRAFCAILL